ncbi:HAD-IA family hydrolase [Gallibacterium genomosp. 1]|uniref:HAD family hydrolase n=1 Tax=Gallibacterium genomosp. 1 TaxID=155515 RepID=A0AB36DZB9_9PAST|nr:HAD-IA family hydrolase [Gallibacterium genomosp. 1]OBX03359.1 HAD family hydrolase [Gallibacterium genomosp. 1]OBX03444.1 HAD family hydrolase [Gallibacterium genomosp. 1]
MHFYRQLQPIRVITFDLDDTLYDNYFVIRAAEQAFLDCLQQLASIDINNWQNYKQQLFQQDPIRYEDVIVWRETAATHLLQAQGIKDADIENIIQQSMQLFIEWRHKINVPTQNRQFLTELAKHYPLVAISNGNVYPPRIGLDQFQLILRGGEHGRAKPHPDLFQQTAHHFQCTMQQILHVGDNLVTDVQGAIESGCQAVWINSQQQSLFDFPEATTLPTLSVKNVTDLTFLFKT